MPERFVLVLAGGRGERFWPWSRPERPKQLLPLAAGGRTLLAATLDRALAVAPPERVVVLTARDLAPAVAGECPRGVRVLGEPAPRNTAPAIGAAAVWFAAEAGDPAFAVMPADHLIDDGRAFTADLERAFGFAEREPALVTFGIRPTGPSTNFGYIRRAAPVADRLYRVSAFTEKPDRERASQWISGGDYAWNSGIFVWRAGVFLDALEAARPAIAAPLRALGATTRRAEFTPEWDRAFPALESISVDYAVLEQAPNTFVLEAAFDWDDLGSWSAWARHQPRDARGNVAFGDTVIVDCDGCVVVGEGGTAAAMGLRDMVVVHVNGATLTCPLAASDGVRRVSDALRGRSGR